jgi:hypothetical protein
MNLETEALYKRLDERVGRGRARIEAAGEVRWLVEIEHRMGMLSKDSSDAAMKVIDDWLGQSDEPAGMLADMYARFLDERVRIRLLNPLHGTRSTSRGTRGGRKDDARCFSGPKGRASRRTRPTATEPDRP